MLSERLKQRGIQHTVLNAKPEHAAREGETVAEAGQPGTVTIATNMAGRGVDIKLGGNAEHLTTLELRKRGLEPEHRRVGQGVGRGLSRASRSRSRHDREKVLEAGGLFILGTERHESRRIDNQLRGRSGRQGDPGESRFYLSAEDDLVRLFAGDRIYRILDRLGPVDKETGEEEPIEAKMLSKQIENAQKKVEEQNFLIRKRVLEYDDVMNQQREIIYEYRDRILEGEDMGETAREQIGDVIERMTARVPRRRLRRGVGPRRPVDAARADVPGRRSRSRTSTATRSCARSWSRSCKKDVVEAYDEREEELGDELMRALERYMLLQIIDERWREHLHDMDYLREGIHLRGFAQIEPLVAYKNEGFEMFTELMNNIWEEFARYIFNVEVEVEGQNGGGQQWPVGGGAQRQPHRPSTTRAARPPTSRARCRPRPRPCRAARCRRRRRGRRVRGRRDGRAAAAGRDAPRRRGGARSAATTRAGAARARSSRSAMAPSALRDQLKLLADYL